MSEKQPAKNQSVVGLVLAAGYSRRFGADKRRAPLHNGQALLAASLTLPCAQLEAVWVVLRPEDDAEVLAVPACVNVVRSESAALGMGHSLASGIKTITQQAQADAAAVFLGDMPWLNVDSLGYLLALASPEHIVVPTFKGQPGHPVIFGRRFWPELQQLTGDRGAKGVLQAYPKALRHLDLNDPGVLRDVDTPQGVSAEIG